MTSRDKTQPFMEVITISDITSQILANAQVVLPNEKSPLKVVTSQTPSGLIFHTAVLAEDAPDPKWPNGRRTYRIVIHGPGESNRRQSMMGLLEETERRVEKQIMRK